MKTFIKTFFAGCFLFVLFLPSHAFAQAMPPQAEGAQPAQSNEVEAVVESIVSTSEEDGLRQMEFKARDENGQLHTVDTSSSYTEGLRYDIEEGDTVILQLLPGQNGEQVAYLSDVKRFDNLLWIFGFFALLTIAVGFWRGLSSLAGLLVTIGILFGFVFPQILAGGDPVVITVLASLVILAVNMHLSHGFSMHTLIAYGSTVAGLLLAVVFSHAFVDFANLSGLASEEATFLFWRAEAGIDPTGILLASIILGAVGVLDDIAITQSETVQELRHANPQLPKHEIFRRAMRVGRHHIASTVNTLVLAYAGAAMPLFLLFLETSGVSIQSFVNTELVSEEIIRTLAGTSALVLVVPISTWLSAHLNDKNHLTEG
jgi:uncharacterized membrane protein